MREIIITAMMLQCVLASAQEPTMWRGHNGTGIYPDIGLLKEWPAEGPEMLWHFDGLGEGHSSPVFANGRIYINGMLNNQGYLFVLSETGHLIDKYKYGEEFFEGHPGTRSSPTVVENLIYILSGKGRLVCMNAENGSIVWEKNFFRDFDGKNIQWGVTETLLVEGDIIYCTPGGQKYNVVALDRITGNVIWASRGKGDLSAYCTPLLVNLASRKILLTHTASNIICIDASDGTLLWSEYHPNTYSIHANTPIYHDGSVFCFSGWEQGSIMIEMDNAGNKKNMRWKDKTFGSQMGGAVLVNGFIYGSGHTDRGWKSLNWNTGEQGYNSTIIGPGVVIYADGNLYCYSQRGELAMVPANPREFKPTGNTRVQLGTGPHWAHPVINRGRLYVRHGNVLMAYQIK